MRLWRTFTQGKLRFLNIRVLRKLTERNEMQSKCASTMQLSLLS
jgi:hypothetical protein